MHRLDKIGRGGWTAGGGVIADQAHLLTARRRGMAEVSVVVLAHLPPTQRRALILPTAAANLRQEAQVV